ncbi:MAG TPA: dTMP kinase [Spirochaetota bacterium]|nr:dTMP kinase [Spirochaetota bacterium]HOM38023.1 dTMP kinase [Spirochaetota bacterium]HPQ48827.1 dTMP kinase [Spirochaetota bacterium]
MKPLFIVFEGIDGSGTTTISKLISKEINSEWDKEPTDSEIGIIIRGILSEHKPINPITLLQLFIADRANHQDKINKFLKSGKSIVLDRYIPSTLAYQGITFEINDLYNLNKNFIKPDIVFYLDISPEVGMERKKKQKGTLELYEDIDVLKKVYEKHIFSFQFLQKEGWNIYFIDANRSIDEIKKEVLNKLKEFYNAI